MDDFRPDVVVLLCVLDAERELRWLDADRIGDGEKRIDGGESCAIGDSEFDEESIRSRFRDVEVEPVEELTTLCDRLRLPSLLTERGGVTGGIHLIC